MTTRPASLSPLGRFLLLAAMMLALTVSRAEEAPYQRLYDSLTVFLSNPAGTDFDMTLEVWDINHFNNGPSELLWKVYPPDGRPVVREIIPDDGLPNGIFGPPMAGWDMEAWYYATSYARAIEPAIKWSAYSDPKRLALMPKRTFTKHIAGGGPGLYKVLLSGTPNHYVRLTTTPNLPRAVAGNPEFLHGHHDLYKTAYIKVPKARVATVHLLFMQIDRPADRQATVKDESGAVLASGNAVNGLVRQAFVVNPPGALDGQVLSVEVGDGEADYLLNVTFTLDRDPKPHRGPYAVTAALASTPEIAKAIDNGAIYHDGMVYWEQFQVRYHDFLKTLPPEDRELPAGLPTVPNYVSVGSHNSPPPKSADVIMHNYSAHKNPHALNAALFDMAVGINLISHGDHIAIGPLRNLAYEMGCYSYFYHRPAWRILQQTDAPAAAKEAIREFIIAIGDRLAMCRSGEMINGNSFASQMAALRYDSAATADPLQVSQFDTVFERFTTGGFGDRVGQGPSGGIQEGFGYDYHYGSYVLRGWRAVNADLKDPRIIAAYNKVLNWYSYIYSGGECSAAPFGSRTHISKPAGGTYDAWNPDYRWKGFGGPNLTESAAGANELFAARRPGYYITTYHGRITPSWQGEGFHGQIGYSGGTICQLFIPNLPGQGQVLAGDTNGDYGGGMHPSQWRNFHLHTMAGSTSDGRPLVTAYSEHSDARLIDNVVTSSGEVRESSVRSFRRFEFGDDEIICEAHLGPASADAVFVLWGGAHGLRGFVSEAWELLPYGDIPTKDPSKPHPKATRVMGLEAGKEPFVLTNEPRLASGYVIDRRGYGVRVEMDKPRLIMLGKNRTVMMQVVPPGSKVPAASVRIAYRLLPYTGEMPLTDIGQRSERFNGMVTLPGTPEAAELPKLMADFVPYKIVLPANNRTLAQVRVGRTTQALAIHATVVDAKPIAAAVAWRGSCLEIFGAQPGQDKPKIGQIFLVPGIGEGQPAAYVALPKGQGPATEIKVFSSIIKGGYEIAALIPFNLLALAPELDELLLEGQISVQAPDGKDKWKQIHGTIFGSRLAYMETIRYGLFKPSPDGKSGPFTLTTEVAARKPLTYSDGSQPGEDAPAAGAEPTPGATDDGGDAEPADP
jgi:hypothetical protein